MREVAQSPRHRPTASNNAPTSSAPPPGASEELRTASAAAKRLLGSMSKQAGEESAVSGLVNSLTPKVDTIGSQLTELKVG